MNGASQCFQNILVLIIFHGYHWVLLVTIAASNGCVFFLAAMVTSEHRFQRAETSSQN